jgi:AcrR family transcriptional regulator
MKGTVKKERGKQQQTLSKEDWLEGTLEVVSRAGGAKLRIDNLVRQLGVTKGSFYWHFKDRKDFILCLIDYWHDKYTISVSSRLDEIEASPGEKLLFLMEMVFVNQLTRHDLAIRSWAVAEPELRALVKRTDDHRTAFLQQLFMGMGFARDAAELRAHVFVGEASWEAARFRDMTAAQREKHALDFYTLLTAGADTR